VKEGGSIIGAADTIGVDRLHRRQKTNLNDPVFAEVIKRAARRLGTVLAEAVAILDPELVLLGGETLQILGDSFVETMVLEIGKSAMPSKPLPPVKRSSLGADAGVIGAATLVLHNAYAPSLQLLNLI
jgi:predicted NBD/HSP70 family sugar kinase